MIMFDLLTFPTLFWVSAAVSLAIVAVVLIRWRTLTSHEFAELYLIAATVTVGFPPFKVGFSMNLVDALGALALQSLMIGILLFAGRVTAR